LDHLSEKYHVFAVDWRGTGASERPPFSSSNVSDCESFFIEGFEAWRQARLGGDVPFTLAGHSLGGYLSTAYALRYPHAVDHLILVNSAGIPPSGGSKDQERVIQAREKYFFVDMLARAWEGGVTPGSIVRALGPWGAGFTDGIVKRRFSHVGSDETEAFLGALSKYVYTITSREGSGEYALSLLLNFAAQAKEPVGPRLLAAAQKNLWKTPTTLIYGQYDWMDPAAGSALATSLKTHGVDAACCIVPQSGHYVFMEAVHGFSSTLLERGHRVKKSK